MRGRLALARNEAERRALIRALARVTAGRLLFFNLVDEHLHLVVRTERPRRLAEGVRRALSALRKDLEFKDPHFEPVGTRPYLRSLVDYVLLQTDRHGIGVAAALWTGSFFQDLVGARLLEGFDRGLLRTELPRLRQRELFERIGLDPEPLVPASDEALARAGPAHIVDLAAGVHAIGPTISDRTAVSVHARALAARVCRGVGFSTTLVARFLGVVPRAVRDLAVRKVDPLAVLTLRRRLALEDRVTGRDQLRHDRSA